MLRVANIFRRRQRGRVVPILGTLIGEIVAGGVAHYKTSQEEIKQMNEAFFENLQNNHNAGYKSKEALQVIKHTLGMDDSSDEEAIKVAEELYEEMLNNRKNS